MKLTKSDVLHAWQNGDVSLGKLAELMQVDKHQLRAMLSAMELPVIDYPVVEVTSEVNWLLADVSK